MKLLQFLIISLLIASSCGHKPQKKSVTNLNYDSEAYIGVHIIDGTGNGLKKDMTIVIKNGKIAEVGKRDSVIIGESTKEIDAKGKWIIPGLIDMHAHVTVLPIDSQFTVIEKYDTAASFEALRTMLALGITTVRNPAAPTRDAIEIRNLVNSGRIIGPDIYTTGFALNRTKASFGPFAATKTEKEIRDEVRSQVQSGVDFIKVYGSLKPYQIRIAIDEAHRHNKKVIGHLQNTSWTDAADLGIDFITHAAPWNGVYLPKEVQSNYRPNFIGRLFWLENVDYSAPSIEEMLSSLVRNNVSVDPTLIAFHTKFWGDDKRYTESDNLKLAPKLVTSIWEKVTFTSSWSPEDYSRAKKQWKKLTGLTLMMYNSGILLTTGSDFPNPWVVPGISLHQEMKLLVEAGIPEGQVIKIATLNGAKALGIDQQTGSIQVGKEANLVFLLDNPLKNIETTKQIDFVLKKGVRHEPQNLNRHIKGR